MLDFRLKALDTYQRMLPPDWGSGLEGLDMDHIVTYVKPNTDQQSDWDSLPDDVKNTFDRLGIPRGRARLPGRRRRAVRLGARVPQHAEDGIGYGHRVFGHRRSLARTRVGAAHP